MSVPSRGAVAILGPTASGKTDLAVAAARRLGALELVSVDAIAVYRGLDIGSAKPTPAQRAGVRWHLVDVADPEEEFSVSRFAALARVAISDIAARGARPLLVGGTGLYHRSVIDDLPLAGRYPEVAARLEEEAELPGGLAVLYERLGRLDPEARSRIEANNRRRIVRALEVTEGSGVRFSASGPGLATYPESAVAQIGLHLERAELDARIEQRLDAQLAAGFLDEVAALARRPGGLGRTAAQALGYRELLLHLDGTLTLEGARSEALRRTRRLARRQMAWFRRDPRVTWVDASDPALEEIVISLVDAAGAGGPGAGRAGRGRGGS